MPLLGRGWPRELGRTFRDHLAPGGWVVVIQPTRTNLERRDRPSGRFLLDDGELPSVLEGLEVVVYEEGWTDTDRHHARIAARLSA